MALASIFPQVISTFAMDTSTTSKRENSIIGHYGDWASGLVSDPPLLSFRQPNFDNIDAWRSQAMAKAEECLSAPGLPSEVKTKVLDQTVYEGIEIETLEWSLPYGRPTRAVFLKPANRRGPLPGVLGLHDHGGNKYLGWRKIADRGDEKPDFIREHHDQYYGGAAWANQLAKRGYAVLIHDTFTFGSRRVLIDDVDGIDWGMPEVPTAPENPRWRYRFYDGVQ